MALRRPAFGIRKEQMYLKTLEAMKRLAILLMLVLFSVASVQAQFAKPLKTNQKKSVFSVATDVFFRPLDDSEITYYVDTFKPFDKAGSYGIQEWIGYVGVERIEGSYFNVMGLPVQRLYQELKKF